LETSFFVVPVASEHPRQLLKYLESVNLHYRFSLVEQPANDVKVETMAMVQGVLIAGIAEESAKPETLGQMDVALLILLMGFCCAQPAYFHHYQRLWLLHFLLAYAVVFFVIVDQSWLCVLTLVLFEHVLLQYCSRAQQNL
jgi:hypothetical protein